MAGKKTADNVLSQPSEPSTGESEPEQAQQPVKAPEKDANPVFHEGRTSQAVLYGTKQGKTRYIQDGNCFDVNKKYICSEEDRGKCGA